MKTLTVLAFVFSVATFARADVVRRSTLCPPQWVEKSGRCYYFTAEKLSWAKAEKFCHGIGGNLASIHTYLEYLAVLDIVLANTMDTGGIWVGGSNAQEESVWLWSDGSKFDFTQWCADEPNSGVCKQNCLHVNYSVLRCWDDDQCSDAKSSVCTRKPNK